MVKAGFHRGSEAPPNATLATDTGMLSRSACGSPVGAGNMTTMTLRLVGVYNADGSWRGELAYLVGRARGTAHFAMSPMGDCDAALTSMKPVRGCPCRSSSVTATRSTGRWWT